MKVGLVQLNAGSDYQKNWDKAEQFLITAQKYKVDWVLFPEVFLFRGKLKEYPEVVWKNENPLNVFQDRAKQYRLNILLGSVYEKSSNPGKVFNTSLLIDQHGKLVGKYRKRNLFNATVNGKKVNESKTFVAGKRIVVASLNKIQVGLSICYDLRFPTLYQQLKIKGAQIITIPAAFTKQTGQAHWEVLVRARAIETGCFVLAPNQIGKDHRGVESYGNSLIVDPWGKVLARGSNSKEEIIFANIDLNQIKHSRNFFGSERRIS